MLKNNSKALFFSVLAIIVLIGAIVIPYIQKVKFSEETQSRKFRKELGAKEIEVDNSLSSIIDFLEIEKFNLSQIPMVEIEKLISSYTSVLIFENDSLVLWSDNSIPVSSKFSDNNFKNRSAKILNGWYDIRVYKQENFSLVGIIPIKNNYSYENQFLKNHFSQAFSILNTVNITESRGKNEIQNIDGDFLFGLKFPSDHVLSNRINLIISLLYFLFYILLIAAIYNTYLILKNKVKHKNLLVFAFIVDMVLMRVILQYFTIPHILYESELFSPELYASSILLPSLGDLLANLVTLLSIAYAVYDNITLRLRSISLLQNQRVGRALLVLIYIFILFQLLYILQNNIVLNSSFSLNLSEINSINIYSVLGLTAFGLLVISFIFLTLKATLYLVTILKSFLEYLAIVSISVFVFFIICNQLLGCSGLHLIFLYFYILSFWIVFKSKSINIQFSSTLFYILLFSVFSTYILYNANKFKEHEYRKLAANNLSTHKDPITEFKFGEVSTGLLNDTTLINFFNDYAELTHEEVEYFIKTNYFNGFWLKYDLLITVCDSSKVLDVQAENIIIDCFEYFDESISEFGVHTDCKNFYYLDYDFVDDYYIGIVDFSEKGLPLKLFIEVFPKNIPKGLGYPELLIDQETSNAVNWSVYSYARYENQELAYRYGKYFYSVFLDENLHANPPNTYFNYDGYSHISCPVNDKTVLIISKQNPSLLDIIAPFSYISIFYGLMILFIYLIIKSPINLKVSSFGFKKRIQFSVTMLITVSFLFVGVGSLFYIISLNTNKNYSILSEKTHSVLIELEHKLAGEPSLNPDMELYLSDLLYKFSLVFFSDINLYDLNGTLLATSRPEIFNEGLKSTKMNPQAFFNLNSYKKSLFIHEEKIGEYKYLSAYIPFRNDENKLIAYLNLPYFAKQDELTNEVSTFLVAFININVILVAIAIFIALIVSNYITKPVQLIKEKISRLRLGKTDEKIEWNKQDEIGGLVNEYNRMVDELAASAELLAKSERESAWRQMAQQVAHEIKNPLTPMKLSVQYLQKAWNEKTPDWDDRLKRFTQTIIEQIESLSVIASEFSNFANMPRSHIAKEDMVEIINNSIELFNNTTKINFTLESQQQCIVIVDREQMLRVFNNLIKNSIQAIPNPVEGEIKITIDNNKTGYLITFFDNGIGIPEDQKEKVFYPNFTTKSSGMGLGLAMVKNIIENAGGSISFESEPGQGTSFYISLPAIIV